MSGRCLKGPANHDAKGTPAEQMLRVCWAALSLCNASACHWAGMHLQRTQGQRQELQEHCIHRQAAGAGSWAIKA